MKTFASQSMFSKFSNRVLPIFLVITGCQSDFRYQVGNGVGVKMDSIAINLVVVDEAIQQKYIPTMSRLKRGQG